MIITILGFLLVRLPLAYYLALDQVTLPVFGWTIPCMGLSVMGAWYAMVADIFFRGMLFFLRFEHGGWLQTRV